MIAIVTDVKYRMSLSLIRDLADRGVSVIACHSGEFPYALASRGVARSAQLPDCLQAPAEYLQELADLCRTCAETPVLLPVGAAALALVTTPEGRSALKGLCHFCLSDPDTLALANDKARLAALARTVGVPVPEEYRPRTPSDFEKLPYPVVIKPLCGEKQGLEAARRYVIARSAAQAREAFDAFTFDGQPPVVQQYLSGIGLGYSVLAQSGVIVNAICHRRVREYPLSGGPSTCCQVIDGEFLRPYAEKLVKALNFTGPAMIEFKLDADGNPRLLEINPRLWGTFPLTRAARSSFAWDWYALAAGLTPERRPPRAGTRMYYLLSDARRGLAVLRQGKLGALAATLADWLLPRAREGVFEWGDLRASVGYLASYLRRGVGV